MNDRTITITPHTQRLQSIASEDAGRYNICGVYYDAKVAVATNGHALALRTKDADEPTNTQVQFDKAKRTGSQQLNILERIGDSTHYASRGGVQAQVIDSEFPNYMTVVDEATRATNTHTITLNAKLLVQLVEALGAERKDYGVTLEVNLDKPKAPIVVMRSQSREGVGLIMPMLKDYDSGNGVSPIAQLKQLTNKEG